VTRSNGLEGELIDVPCPRCGYVVEVELLDAVCQSYRWCPCCRVRVHFNEGRADVYGPLEDVESAMRELDEQIDELNRAFGKMFR
jgi:hypothetical protein